MGLAKICRPNLTNALPNVLTIPVMPFNAPLISALPILPKLLANTCDFWLASSKSNEANELVIPPKLLLICSNLDPLAKTLTASLASFILSESSPAFLASASICAGSVASAIATFNALNSAFIEPTPVSFNGIVTSFITILSSSRFEFLK